MVDRSPEQEKYAHDETFGMYFVFVLFFLFLFLLPPFLSLAS